MWNFHSNIGPTAKKSSSQTILSKRLSVNLLLEFNVGANNLDKFVLVTYMDTHFIPYSLSFAIINACVSMCVHADEHWNDRKRTRFRLERPFHSFYIMDNIHSKAKPFAFRVIYLRFATHSPLYIFITLLMSLCVFALRFVWIDRINIYVNSSKIKVNQKRANTMS